MKKFKKKFKRRIDIKRTFSMFVAAMFILSMVGAVYEIRASKQQAQDITKTNIITRELQAYERRAIISSGDILIEFERNEICGRECDALEETLRGISNDYGQFVVVSVFYGDEALITLTSPYGIVERYNVSEANSTIIETFICKNSIKKPESCILREIM
jgi:hypothetical protein